MSVIHMTQWRWYHGFRGTMNILYEAANHNFLESIVNCGVWKMLSYDKGEVKCTSTHYHVPFRDSKEVKSSQIDLNIYNLLNKFRNTITLYPHTSLTQNIGHTKWTNPTHTTSYIQCEPIKGITQVKKITIWQSFHTIQI